jgi:hypothetical protein
MENVASKKCLQEEAGSCNYHSEELEGSEATKSLQGSASQYCPCPVSRSMSFGCPTFQENETSCNSDPVSVERIHQKKVLQTKHLLHHQASVTHKTVNLHFFLQFSFFLIIIYWYEAVVLI